MIILDTNVLSELMRADPAPAVLAWLDRQPLESVWIASVTLFETRLGLALLPAGRRGASLTAAFGALLVEDLGGRVLPFDADAAIQAAALTAVRQRGGRPVDVRDTQSPALRRPAARCWGRGMCAISRTWM